MKLTKRLLAIVLAAAMLVGMVVISTSAVQLDADVPTYTEDDCTTFDLESNPYTAKVGFKVYKVNTEDGSYELLPDTVDGNDTNDVKVSAGDVIRVEVWAQTNFHCYAIQLTPAYNNAWLLPTRLDDYSTYELKADASSSVVPVANGMAPVTDFDDSYGAGDGSFDAPIYSNEALTTVKGQTNHNTYAGLKSVLPKAWRGTGTKETNWLSTTAVDQWGNTVASADEDGVVHSIYNVYQFGQGYSSAGDANYGGYATVLNVYQPLVAFNLTVAEGAEGSANLFLPEDSLLSPDNTSGTSFFTALGGVQDSDNHDTSTPQITVGAGLTQYKQYCLYGEDTTKYSKVWDITNATITVGSAEVEDTTTTVEETTVEETTVEETTTEETTVEETTTEAPIEYANLEALQAAITAAKAADLDNRTSDTLKAYNDALAAAEALNVEGTLATEQDAIDAATKALNDAVANLAYLGKVNVTALNDAINAYKALDQAAWTPASWTASDVDAKYAAAIAVDQDMYADEAGANQATVDTAAAELDAAIKALVAVADKTALKAAIDTVVDTANCTSASIAAYEAALEDANEVYADANATQDEVDAAKDALVAAQTLEKLGKVNVEALNDAINAYKALDQAAWTPASWTASDIDAKYATAIAVDQDMYADEEGANQATVDTAATELDAAIKALVAVADKDDLVAAIARASALAEDAYTPASWTEANLAAVLEAANTVNADANATQDAVDNAVAAIEAAEGKLVVKADKDALATAIANAKALDEADYTPNSWAAADLATVIADAETVYNNGDATDAEVTAAINALATATAALDELADKTDLEDAIETLPTVSEEDADPETWAAYTAALAAAQLVFDDPNASDEDVAKAETELRAAIAGVLEKETVYCDYEDLDAAIKQFEDIDASLYTPDSYAAVKVYYDAAKAVERNMEYTVDNQDAIDAATDALTNSIAFDLVELADKTALKAAIDTVVDTTNCTSASIAAYEAALEDANEVYADANATQDEVDAAKDALVAAQTLEKLQKVDYSDLEEAMDKFEDLNESDWTPETWADAKAAYDVAADLLAQDLYDDEDYVNAGKVDEATDNLNNAIGVLKAAVDKTALLEEINKAASVEEDYATDATWAEYVNALTNAEDVYADDAATQEDVDDAKNELAAANAALATRDLVNYDALDAALALVPAEAEDAYTVASWKAYANAKAAAEAVARDLIDNKSGTNAKLVADAAEALTDAYNALKINAANITNVEWDNTDYYVPGTLAYAFTVNEAPSKIQVISPDGGTMTFDRRSSRVSVVSYNADGEVVDYADEDPAYEVWTINLVLSAGEYEVRAKYNYTWDTEHYVFTVEYDEYDTQTATFTASAGDVVDATEITVAAGDLITFKAVTDATAIKVRFVFADGGTSTYSRGYAVDNGDGTLTWTITRVFNRDQDINLSVKAPTGWGAEYSGNVKVTIE